MVANFLAGSKSIAVTLLKAKYKIEIYVFNRPN